VTPSQPDESSRSEEPDGSARPVPRVSVVMPAYNSEKYLTEAIRSITSQSFKEVELIVVDGGSTDRTSSIVEDISAQDARVRLVRQAHTGIVDGRNRGAALARGEYLAWLDADDVAAPHRFERQVQFLDIHAGVAAVGGNIVVTDEHLRPRLRVTYPTDSAQIAATLPDANVLATSATMLRLSAYRSVGGCRRAFKQGAEDYDLWLRLSERHPLANLPEVLAYYRTHASQVSSSGVERFVIPTVAAQLSATARRKGQPDVYGDVDVFTYEWLASMAQNRIELDHAILNAAAGQATYLALIGQPDTARSLLEWANSTVHTRRIARLTRAHVQLAKSIGAWQDHRRSAALVAGIQAAALDPVRFARMVARGLGALGRLR
jgi:glycosyltransferase involved in cell wall biosynthesis